LHVKCYRRVLYDKDEESVVEIALRFQNRKPRHTGTASDSDASINSSVCPLISLFEEGF